MSRPERSKDHVPSKELFPRASRHGRLQLRTLPSHVACNSDYSEDEEYFRDVLVRMATPTPAAQHLVREYLGAAGRSGVNLELWEHLTTNLPGGLALPPGRGGLQYDATRVDRVLTKIARGLLWLDRPRRPFVEITSATCELAPLSDFVADVMPRFQWPPMTVGSGEPGIFRYWSSDARRDGQWASLLLFEFVESVAGYALLMQRELPA